MPPLRTLSSSSPSLSSPSLSSMKLKALLQAFIFSHLCRLTRALTKSKSLIIHLLKDIKNIIDFRRNKSKKLFFASFRLHYNWCSSQHVPLEAFLNGDGPTCKSTQVPMCPNATWKGPTQLDFDGSDELSKYLQWLEEKGEEEWSNEIDKLADLFIANCHEKFRLEKQESYRMFQEMMARSV